MHEALVYATGVLVTEVGIGLHLKQGSLGKAGRGAL